MSHSDRFDDAAKTYATDRYPVCGAFAKAVLSLVAPDPGDVVLDDLMFSDEPDAHRELFDVVGYGPGSDTPATVSCPEAMFAEAGMAVDTHLLSPLAGVMVGTKR